MTQGDKEKRPSPQWHVAIEGKRQGPYSLDKLREMIGDGRVPPDALVWKPDMREWLPWGNVLELAGARVKAG